MFTEGQTEKKHVNKFVRKTIKDLQGEDRINFQNPSILLCCIFRLLTSRLFFSAGGQATVKLTQ